MLRTLTDQRRLCSTRGASGIGRSIAIRFAAAGAFVTIADLEQDAGSQLANDITDGNGHATFVHCDVTDYQSCVLAFKYALESSPTGSPDIVVLMAGVLGAERSLVDQIAAAGASNGGITTDSQPPRPKHTGIDINLVAVYECVYLALYYLQVKPRKKSQETGQSTTKSLILPASPVAYIDTSIFTDYSVSKCKSPALHISRTPLTSTINSWRPWFDPLTPRLHSSTRDPHQRHCTVVRGDSPDEKHISGLQSGRHRPRDVAGLCGHGKSGGLGGDARRG